VGKGNTFLSSFQARASADPGTVSPAPPHQIGEAIPSTALAVSMSVRIHTAAYRFDHLWTAKLASGSSPDASSQLATVGGSTGVKFVAMICAGRNGAAGFRAARWGGMAGSAVRTAQMVAACPHDGESVPWRASGGRHSLPRRSRIRKVLRKTGVSVEMGASKTVPPASTREETSSL
jgi:hypothetical protein